MSSTKEIKVKVDKVIKNINQQITSRGVRVGNVLRNAELEVLSGQRSGKVYRKPHTKRATYTASAPGEVPARRSGKLRLGWKARVEGTKGGHSVSIKAVLESNAAYSTFLEKGTVKIQPRPFKNKIIEKAMPEIKEILGKSYN